MKRQQSKLSPSQALSEEVKKETFNENNVSSKVERKRVSFDLRTDLHQELKMQAVIQDKNIYVMIEEALEDYFKKK